MPYDDLQFLDAMKPLGQFREIVESGGGLYKLALVADSLCRTLDAAEQDGLRARIEMLLLDKNFMHRASHFDDYGPWRAKNNNAYVGEWVHARGLAKDRFKSLPKCLDNLKWFESGVTSTLDHFSSLEDLIRVSVALSKVVEELKSKRGVETLISPAIETRDCALCIDWSGKKPSVDFEMTTLSDVLGSYEAARLLSARAAEKAAAQYYQSLGERVEDVSVTQLEGSDGQWKDFDLLVGQRPIDVKNARKSFSSPNTYVEHCVSKFKIERKYSITVSIAGVLSDYGEEDQIWSRKLNCRILGEVNVASIRKLYSWMRRRFGSLLDLQGLWRQGYVPGWMFEYPSSHYEDRRATLLRLEDLLNAAIGVCKSTEPIPGWILTLAANKELVESLSLSETKRKILRDLHQLNNEVGFSRPSLFLYSMGVMLESLLVEIELLPLSQINRHPGRWGRLSGYEPSSNRIENTLRELLFCNEDQSRPLFLLDTQMYVANLINLLPRVRDEMVRQKVRFTGFLMPHPSILRGLREGLPPITLIAYCGGWREVPTHIRCGAAPLYFGKHQNCPSCGRLVCDICGYCADGCSLVVERQARVAKTSRRSRY